MVLSLVQNIFGTSNERAVKKLSKSLEGINALEESLENLSDNDLKAKTDEFRDRLNNGETLDNILKEAFAVVREAAKRTLGQRHYDVQMIGGLTLHNGMIAEMRTGEGKTLVATLAVYLNALEGIASPSEKSDVMQSKRYSSSMTKLKSPATKVIRRSGF